MQSVRGPGLPGWPSARDQAAWPAGQLHDRAGTWAASVHELGVTLDLAPVADVADGALSPSIGALSREYAASPQQATGPVVTVTEALVRAHVGATAKHFPGLGRITVNTDRDAGGTDPLTTADDPALRPFAAAAHAGAVAVMMSSATYPKLDPAERAVFSRPIITGLLHDRLGFDGLVVSVDLSRAGAVADVPVGERAVRFLSAGGDLVLIVRSSAYSPMLSAVRARAATSPQFRDRLHDAAYQVLLSKARVGLLTCTSP